MEEDKELQLTREQTRGAVEHVREEMRQLRRVLLLEQIINADGRVRRRSRVRNRDERGRRN
jgi:hypothetical protein